VYTTFILFFSFHSSAYFEVKPIKYLSFTCRLSQAALYRLNGDVNPLHIDPNMAALMGFKAPIMHGLCSLGIVVRQLIRHFDIPTEAFVSVKVRFNAPVVPGQVLETSVWVEQNRVFFTTTVLGSDKSALTGQS
jgi:3-hydroxyacyl-CoA dehydrogenase/3a,7a,12a-trihydroxy-5b-cholest-24-enoyl-CoA hydratase